MSKINLHQYNCDKWMRYEDDIAKYYYPKILQWIKTNPRQPSEHAFTSGLARHIARLIEDALREEKMRTSEVIPISKLPKYY